MRNFKKKLHGQEGFTLVEMLIVVAIIAILIAVSIPIIRSALDKARHSTDAANERAAKAAILVAELSDPTFAVSSVHYYDAKGGKLSPSAVANGYGQHKGHKNQIIALTINPTSDAVSMNWITAGSTVPSVTGADPTGDDALCSSTEVNH